MRKLSAFPWFGGKLKNLSFILQHLPLDANSFVDVFGGSAAVILNAGPYKIETYNDLDGEVVNFFRVLREKRNELIERISLTPYSRAEFAQACQYDDSVDDVERARHFYIRARMAVAGKQIATPGIWSYITSSGNDKPKAWVNSHPKLVAVAARFMHLQIENKPALDIISRYDTPDTLFYLDPPYLLGGRNGKAYRHEMTDDDHVELAEALHKIKGRAVLSGYHSDLYDRLYDGWHVVEDNEKMSSSKFTKYSDGKHYSRQEVLWSNFRHGALDC